MCSLQLGILCACLILRNFLSPDRDGQEINYDGQESNCSGAWLGLLHNSSLKVNVWVLKLCDS